MQSFSSFRGAVPYLLMSDEQKQRISQLEYNNRITRNFDYCYESRKAFEEMLSRNTRNKPVLFDAISRMDDVFSIIKNCAIFGMPQAAFHKSLIQIKLVHDDLQKIGELQNYSKILDSHIETIKKLYQSWQSVNTITAVTVKSDNQPAVEEGIDYRMSKPYYDREAKRWIQRKVEVVDKEKKKEYEKESSQMRKESLSFKNFYNESQLNSTSRLQADGDVKTDDDDSLYIDKSKKIVKPKYKVKPETIQADPLSS